MSGRFRFVKFSFAKEASARSICSSTCWLIPGSAFALALAYAVRNFGQRVLSSLLRMSRTILRSEIASASSSGVVGITGAVIVQPLSEAGRASAPEEGRAWCQRCHRRRGEIPPPPDRGDPPEAPPWRIPPAREEPPPPLLEAWGAEEEVL